MKEPAVTTIAQWQAAWLALGARADLALFAQLCGCYTQCHRHYHTLRHLRECLRNAAALAQYADRPAEVAIALWFHDAIYDVTAHDSEARSADWARDSAIAAGLDEAVAARLHRLILATRHTGVPGDADAQVLLDADLWILGAPSRRFAQYEQQVRREYRHVPDAAYRHGRRQVLVSFQDRAHIFNTPLLRAHCEAVARENLGRSIARLG